MSTLAIDSGLVVSSPESGQKIVQSRLVIEPLELRDTQGKVADSRGSYDMTVAFHLRWSGSAWQLAEGVKVE